MKSSLFIVLALLLSLGLTTTIFAQNENTKTPTVTRRQGRQQRRIANGVRSGQLTAGEASRLERQEKHIQQDKKAAKSDGVVTKQERRNLRHQENRTSRHIYRDKHNNRKRG